MLSVNYYYFLGINITIPLLVLINYIFILLISGYGLKMVKSSINNEFKAPKFNNWKVMFMDGVKRSVVDIFYFSPLILFIIVFSVLYPSSVIILLKTIEYHPHSVIELLTNILSNLNVEIVVIIGSIFYFFLFPIRSMAIAHMAYDDTKLTSAFKLREILNKMGNIGWKKLIKWNITILLIAILIKYIGYWIIIYSLAFIAIVSNTFVFPFYLILLPLIFAYSDMFSARAIALLYVDENSEDFATTFKKNNRKEKHNGYLVCNKCNGYYELQPDESPENFEERCECGGKLEHHKYLRE